MDVLQIKLRSENSEIWMFRQFSFSPLSLLLFCLFQLFIRRWIIHDQGAFEGLAEADDKVMPSYPKSQKFEPWEDDGCAGVAEASIWGRVDWTAGENVIRIMYQFENSKEHGLLCWFTWMHCEDSGQHQDLFPCHLLEGGDGSRLNFDQSARELWLLAFVDHPTSISPHEHQELHLLVPLV